MLRRRPLVWILLLLGLCSVEAQVRINEVLATSNTRRNAQGRILDSVELYNFAPFPVDLSAWSLSDSAVNTRRYVFPDGSSIQPGGFVLVDLDPSNTNNNFGLKSNGDTIRLFRPDGTLEHSVSFGIQVPDLSIGAVPDGSDNWTATIFTPGPANTGAPNVPHPLESVTGLKINEWAATGGDFFEVYNPGARPVAMGGLYVTDDLSRPTKHQIAPLSFVSTGQLAYVKFIADKNLSNGADHVDFNLSANGESVGLYIDALTPIDAITYGVQEPRTSEGRLPDGSGNIVRFEAPSPGQRNYGTVTNIVVNELLAHSDPPLEDALELLNLTDGPIDISGWYLSDQFDDLKRYRLPEGSVIPPHGFKVFYEFQFGAANVSNPTSPIRWNSARGGTVFLSEPAADGEIIRYLARPFFSSENAVSFGRWVTSDGRTDFVPMVQRSFGMDKVPRSARGTQLFRTGGGLPNESGPRVWPAMISELHYRPEDLPGFPLPIDNTIDEFIELRNLTTTTLLLYDPAYPNNGWQLRGGAGFTFTRIHSIPPSGYLLIVNFNPLTDTTQLAAFKAKFKVPAGVPMVGPYSGKLGNTGEKLELFRPDKPQKPGRPDAGYVPYLLVDRVDYSPDAPWPTGAAGTGLSIQRFGGYYGNDPAHWKAARPTAGSVAPTVPLAITEQPQNTAALTNTPASFTVAVSGEGPLYQWYFKGKPLAGANRSTLVVPSVTRATGGDYSVVVRNDAGAVHSAIATLTPVKPVIIRSKPMDKVVLAGRNAAFRVRAAGTGPFTYQWFFEGEAVPNGTGTVLALPGVQSGASGQYVVVINNAFSSASLTNTLKVTP